MARGRYFDGRTTKAHDVDVSAGNGNLTIRGGGVAEAWPMSALDADVDADRVRLSWSGARDARLVVGRVEWLDLAGQTHALHGKKTRRREMRIVGGLAAFAAAVVLFVFVGVPAMSGPLARMTPTGLERRMGENFERQISPLMPRCEGEAGQALLHGLGQRIASGADTSFDIRVYAVQAPMINALALPGGVVMVTDDLIREAEGPDELAAVVAHEVAHIEKRHVMQAVLRSLGMGMVLDAVVGGGTGAGQQAVILAGNASELSYGRDAEREADARGQDLLHRQGLSSKGMAVFFGRLSQSTGSREVDLAAEFASTHPDSARRARVARTAERDGRPALTQSEWETVRRACRRVDYDELQNMRRRLDPRR